METVMQSDGQEMRFTCTDKTVLDWYRNIPKGGRAAALQAMLKRGISANDQLFDAFSDHLQELNTRLTLNEKLADMTATVVDSHSEKIGNLIDWVEATRALSEQHHEQLAGIEKRLNGLEASVDAERF